MLVLIYKNNLDHLLIIFCPVFLYQFYCFIPFILLLSGTSKTPAFQKESFWLAKRVLLPYKRSPFEMQNESFYTAKGVLLISPRISLSLFTTNYSNLTNAAVLKDSCDSCDSCCLSFTTNFSNLTNVAALLDSCDSCDSCCLSFTTNFPNLTNVAEL